MHSRRRLATGPVPPAPPPGRTARLLALTACAAFLMACEAPGGAGTPDDPVCAAVKSLRGPARREVLAVARILAIRPSMAIDFSDASGEYCLNTGSRAMTHFAALPEESDEDIVYFIDAAPLVAHGLRLDEFPLLEPGAPRRPDTWYRYEGEGTEPHHGREMSERTWLVLAVDVK
ncbi:MAG: hypothetical protein ACE5JH_05435 [Acidobacteriota bacterium]